MILYFLSEKGFHASYCDVIKTIKYNIVCTIQFGHHINKKTKQHDLVLENEICNIHGSRQEKTVRGSVAGKCCVTKVLDQNWWRWGCSRYMIHQLTRQDDQSGVMKWDSKIWLIHLRHTGFCQSALTQISDKLWSFYSLEFIFFTFYLNHRNKTSGLVCQTLCILCVHNNKMSCFFIHLHAVDESLRHNRISNFGWLT